MKTLYDFSMIATDSCRSRAYLWEMQKHNMLPSFVVLIKIPAISRKSEEFSSTPLFDNLTPLEDMMEACKVKYKILNVDHINDLSVLKELKKLYQKYVIFSIPGYILGKGYFTLGKEYIHVHPGKLPDYRGSTPMYYSILKEKKLTATAIFLKEKIDVGPILGTKDFELPEEKIPMDTVYDPFIRAQLLVEVLKNYCKERQFITTDQSHEYGESYYIIHPVLKCLSIKRIPSEKRVQI